MSTLTHPRMVWIDRLSYLSHARLHLRGTTVEKFPVRSVIVSKDGRAALEVLLAAVAAHANQVCVPLCSSSLCCVSPSVLLLSLLTVSVYPSVFLISSRRRVCVCVCVPHWCPFVLLGCASPLLC